MRDKFDRAYNFVYRHRGTFGYIAGVSVMTAVVVTAKRKPYTIGIQLNQTAEEVSKILTEFPVMEIVSETGNKIYLFTKVVP